MSTWASDAQLLRAGFCLCPAPHTFSQLLGYVPVPIQRLLGNRLVKRPSHYHRFLNVSGWMKGRCCVHLFIFNSCSKQVLMGGLNPTETRALVSRVCIFEF